MRLLHVSNTHSSVPRAIACRSLTRRLMHSAASSTPLLVHEDDYDAAVAADPAHRFAQALEHFVWQAVSVPFVGDALAARCDGSDAQADDAQSDSARVAHALQSALRAASPCGCAPRTDPATEAGLYMLRLTRVLEQRVLYSARRSMRGRVVGAAATAPRDAARSLECSGAEADVRTGSSTVRRHGRRFSVPDAAASLRSSMSSPDSRPADFSLSPSICAHDSSDGLTRFHAELTLALQQCMLRCMCELDAAVCRAAEEDAGLSGVLTRPRAAQLQRLFLKSITQALVDTQRQWRETFSAGVGNAEAMSEVAAVLEGLAHASQGPQLRVFELSGGGTAATRCSPPPFASWPPVSASLRPTASAVPAIRACLGVAWAEYSAKLTAQHLWCAQRLLSQRFPAYTGPWELLERARFLVESARSPTPTVPRSDSAEPGAASPAARPEWETVKEAHSVDDDSAPPPRVAVTQRKAERPYDLLEDEALQLGDRGLTFSEERSSSEPHEAQTDATVSSSRLPSTFRGVAPATPPAAVPLLLVARCPLWDDYLAAHNISRAATRLAVQHVAAGSCAPLAHPTQVLREVPLNQPSKGQEGKGRRIRDFSIETVPRQTAGQSAPARPDFARSM